MISIDPKIQGVSSASKLKKLSKKDQDNSIRFFAEKKTQGASSGESSTGVADISGMFYKKLTNMLKIVKILKNLAKKLLIR